MKIIEVNPSVEKELSVYRTLRDKTLAANGSFIADSPKVVNLLLESEIEIVSILATQEYLEEHRELLQQSNPPLFYLASKEYMQKIVGHKIHHNCMMHGIRPHEHSLETLGDKIVMLDNITSSENVGAIARSAAALSVDGYLLPRTSPHPFSRRALRVSMGYASYLNIALYEDIFATIEQLQSLGYHIYAAEVREDAIPLREIQSTEKWVLIMGHEGFGIREEILQKCDTIVSIEMSKSVKSFNVSVAASLIMYRLNL